MGGLDANDVAIYEPRLRANMQFAQKRVREVWSRTSQSYPKRQGESFTFCTE